MANQAASNVTWHGDTATILLDGPETCQHCRLSGVVFADGRRCREHASAEDVRAVDELDARAATSPVGLARSRSTWWGEAFNWPYGPNIDLRMRVAMLEWAEAEGLTYVDKPHRCLRWLREGACRSVRCRSRVESHWQDHVTCWARGGQPAVLVAQPYHLSAPDVSELGALDAEPGLRVELRAEGSWYGLGTWFVGVWRVAS